MIRRSTILLAVSAASLLTGCGTFDDDVVASVDGASIDTNDFDAVADDYFGNPELFEIPGPSAGRIDGEQARLLLTVLIRQQLLLELLDENDVDPTEPRQTFLEAALADGALDEVSVELQELIADSNGNFQSQVLAAVPAPSPAELEATYRADPVGVGMVCLRHILVETEAEAAEIADLVRDGADFAELAAERSIDETTAVEGGALATPAGQCIPVRTMAQGFDPAFAGAVLDAESDLIGPVESSFGWHVILHRPWDEIADSVLALHVDGESGGYQFDGRLATADIDVDPQFGVWNRLSGGVAALG